MPRKEPDTAAQNAGEGQPDPAGVPALEVEGDHELPPAEHRQYEGGDGTHPGAPSEQDEEEGKAGGHQGLPAQAVVVAHGDIGDGVPVVAHHHLGPVPGREELVLLQRAVEHVDPGDRPSLKSAVQDLKLAALLTRADQAGVDDGGRPQRQWAGPEGAGWPAGIPAQELGRKKNGI